MLAPCDVHYARNNLNADGGDESVFGVVCTGLYEDNGCDGQAKLPGRGSEIGQPGEG